MRRHPPHGPCIAEFGADSPAFLSGRPATERVPYLRAFAELEWGVGLVSVAVDNPPIGLDELSAVPTDALPDAVLVLQPGLRYLHAEWPVDGLIKLYLAPSINRRSQ